jgi:hypothetical protein
MVWNGKDLKALYAGVVPASSHLRRFGKMIVMRLARSKGSPAPSLSTLLLWTWRDGLGEEATNLRDRIFALLRLTDSLGSELFVGYSLGPHGVFWEIRENVLSYH